MLGDDVFLRQFEECSLPRSEWRHRAHLKVAYLYLGMFSFDEAVVRMRAGIQAYNASQGIVDTPTSGYHETITLAWLRILDTTVREYGRAASADEFLDAHPQLGGQKILRLFYSRELMMSAAAKSTFVEPDVAPLPISRLEKSSSSS